MELYKVKYKKHRDAHILIKVVKASSHLEAAASVLDGTNKVLECRVYRPKGGR